MSGQRTPWSAPIPGAMRRWPCEVGRDRRGRRNPVAQRAGERVRIVEQLRQRPCTEGLGVGPAVGDEGGRLAR